MSREYRTEEEDLNHLKLIENRLNAIVDMHADLEQDFITLSQRVPGTLKKITNSVHKIIENLEVSSSHIEKFKSRAFFRTNQRREEINGETVTINEENYVPSVFFNRHEKVGEFQHAIIEQIECVDKIRSLNEDENYEEFNEMLANRIFYTNQTMDLCLKNLVKKL